MRRWLALGLLALAVMAAAVFALVGSDVVGVETLRRYNSRLSDFVAARPVLAPVAFVGAFVAAILASLPTGALFTVAGGYLFGWFGGVAYTLIAQMIGATTLFLLGRRALAERVLARAGPKLRSLREGFRHNALSYVFVLRVTGVLPSFLVNAVPGALGVRPRTYLLGSALGVLPGTVVYAGIGAGLGSLAAAERALEPANLLTPAMVVGLAGLVLLALTPVAYKYFEKRRHA